MLANDSYMLTVPAIPAEKIILGIDPGTQVAGYGVIQITNGKISLLQYGVVKLSQYSTHELKLKKLYDTVLRVIDDYLPDEMAIEDPFFGKNVQAMLKLGRAQGVSMAAALSRNIPIVEYAPRSVKLSVTGNGNASKDQVSHMVGHLLGVELNPEFFDATDAVAIAICHHFHANAMAGTRSTSSGKKNKKGGWGAFVGENPERVG